MLSFSASEPADVPVIFAQAKALIDAYEDLSAIDYEKVLSWTERKITAYIESYNCVWIDGEKCAYYRLSEDGELDDVYVLPSFRGQGIGSAILKKCIEDSKAPLWLYVFKKNSAAIRLYRRFGFEIRETVDETRQIMRREI